MEKIHIYCVFITLLSSHLILSVVLSSSEIESREDVNVVELSYIEAAASTIEGGGIGVTEDFPEDTTTQGYLPVHPELKESDKFSVPKAQGREKVLGNLTIYESPFKNGSNSLLITFYDIFGFHPHVKYIADKLAEASGSIVIIPDFFHGNQVEITNFPQPDFAEKAIHLFSKNGSWIDIMPDIQNVIKTYKIEHNIKSIGMYGFCWGGKMVVYAASYPDFKDLKAIGLVHPSRVANEEAKDIKIPAILLPSKSEPNMLPFLKTLNGNDAGRNLSEHFRFEDLAHGFAGARSDFSDKQVRAGVEQVIQRLSKFFIKVFDEPN